MKIRIGFVSNSSSSNFIIIGSSINCKDVSKLADILISKKRLYAQVKDGMDEGCDFFPVSTKMWELYKKYGAKSHIYFYDVLQMAEGHIKISKDSIDKKELDIFAEEISHHSCTNSEEFQERYICFVPADVIDKVNQVKKLKKEIEEQGYNIEKIEL
jgi:hypothetical protein